MWPAAMLCIASPGTMWITAMLSTAAYSGSRREPRAAASSARAASGGVQVCVTVSVGRKVWRFEHLHQAIQMTVYTTRSLKRDETAGYIRLVRDPGEGDPDTFVSDVERGGLESLGTPMDSDTYVGNRIDDLSDCDGLVARPTAGSYLKAGSALGS